MRSPTIFEVAARAGVSTSTVSRVLNDRGYISDIVRQAVSQAVEELSYVPHARARSLRVQRSRVIAVVAGDPSTPRVAEILKGIKSVTDARGYLLLISTVDECGGMCDGAAVQSLLEQRPDGIIAMSLQAARSDRLLSSAAGAGMPVALVGRQIDEAALDSVSANYEHGAELLVGHLVERGHRRIGFVGAAAGDAHRVARLRGFLAAMQMRNLPVHATWMLGDRCPRGAQRYPNFDTGFAAGKRLLQLEARPTALLTRNDHVALGVIAALKEGGLQLPNDCAVVGYGDSLAGRHSNPSLTTIHIDGESEGREVAQLLVSRIEGNAQESGARRVLTDMKLVVRDSSAPR